MFKPKKTIYAKITYADIAGLDASAGKSGISGSLLNQLTQMDGYIHVVRCFENDNVPHLEGKVDPRRDLDAMDSEFILNDLIFIERELKDWRMSAVKAVPGREKTAIDREIALFERMQAAFSEETPLRDHGISSDEESSLSGFRFLSLKPVMVVLNLSEGQMAPQMEYHHQHSCVVSMQGKLEMEMAQLAAEDAEMFMEEYGISELSLNRMIKFSYDLLGQHSFFTVGEDECRAWTVRTGARAPKPPA